MCVVGDEDQSIYSWRGADIRNILDFERDYPNAAVIRLEQNYRSTKNILEAASAVVAQQHGAQGQVAVDRGRRGANASGRFEAFDGEQEALFIADTIEKLLTANPEDRVAVLYRTNFQSRQIEEALRRYGRDYVVVGGFSFYQRAEIKDALAYLKAARQPARFGQPAAHHQHAGARHRQEHHRADRAVRARARAERLVGDRADAGGECISRRAREAALRAFRSDDRRAGGDAGVGAR